VLPSLCPFLFSFATREQLIKCTAFGVSQTIFWLQEQRVDPLLRRRLREAENAIGQVTEMTGDAAQRAYDRLMHAQEAIERQRIGKQPPSASAGSFFKNVNDKAFAESLPDLREDLKASGVVPAGHLIERVGLRGVRLGGAMIGQRHANFMLNARGATASEVRRLAEHAQAKVRDRYGVELEAEVLMIGDWSGWQVTGLLQP